MGKVKVLNNFASDGNVSSYQGWEQNHTSTWVCFNIYLSGRNIQERRACWKKNKTLRYQRQRRWEDHHRRVEVTLEPTLCRAPWPTDTYTISTNKTNFNPTNYQIANIQECSWKTKMYHLITWRGLNWNSYGHDNISEMLTMNKNELSVYDNIMTFGWNLSNFGILINS